MAKGTAPKTSKRPRSRSQGKGLGLRPKTKDEVVEAEKSRKSSEAFGDVEFGADLAKDYLDPLSRLGFDPKVAKTVPSGFNAAGLYVLKEDDITRQLDENRPEGAYKEGIKKGDVLTLGDFLGSKTVWTHEFRHRGLNKLMENFKDADEFIEKYIPDADPETITVARAILQGPSEEVLTDYMDRRSPPEPGFRTELLSDDTKSLKKKYIKPLESVEKAILTAARDRLTEEGVPLPAERVEKEEPGWLSKLFDKMGFAEGGQVLSKESNPILQHHKKNVEEGTYVKNDDGSISTVYTTIMSDGEYEYLIPQVWDGKILSEEEAWERAMSSGIDWPKEPSGKEGVRKLEQLDKQLHENMSGYSEGGEVSMKKQMSLFEYGGLADDGMDQEPVTGNEIPPGSMAKEVRDDVPAMLSEGEYVVPADVVRYYGVKFFEDLRGEAKSGMMEMEEDGRIGGEPVNSDGTPIEMDLSEEEMQMLQQLSGDVMPGMAEGGSVYNTSNGSGFETRQYVNIDTGEIRSFQFLNGQPVGFIPQNFIPATDEAIAEAEAKMESETQTEGTGTATGEVKPEADGTGYQDARDYDTVAEPGKGFLGNLFGGGKKGTGSTATPTAPAAPGTATGPTGPMGTPSMPGTPSAPTGMTGTTDVPAGTGKEPLSNPFSGMPNSAPTPSLSGLGEVDAPGLSSPGFPSISTDTGLENAYSNAPEMDMATDLAVDMMALSDAVTKGKDTLSGAINNALGRGYANPPSTSANLTGIMSGRTRGTDFSQPDADTGVDISSPAPSIAAPSISGAMSAALGGFGTSKGGEYSGAPTDTSVNNAYSGLAGSVGLGSPSNAPSGNFGGGNGSISGAQSAAAMGFSGGRGGEFGGGPDGPSGPSGGSSGGTGGGGADSGAAAGGGSSGGSSGGDAGTGSDNDGDGFGDMGGISGGWNKGGLVGYQGGGDVNQPWQQPPLYPTGNPYTGNPYNSGSFEARKYVNNDTGEVRTFQFLNGQPIGYIPPGFVPATQEAIDSAKTPKTQTQGTGVATGQVKKIEERGGEPNQQQGTKDPLGPIGKVDFSDPLGDAKDALSGKGITGGIIGGLAGALFGLPTVGAKVGSSLGKVGNIAEAAANSEIAAILGYDTKDINKDIDEAISKLGKLSGKMAQNQVNEIRGTAKDKFFEELRSPTSTMQFDLEVSNFQNQEAYQSALDNLARSVEVSQGVPTGSVVAMGRDDPGDPAQFAADFAAASAHAEANPTGQTTGQPLGLDDISLPGEDVPDSNGDGGDSATVICTALHNLGMLDSSIYALDAEYGRLLESTNPEVLYGYRKMATPLADYIQEDTLGARVTRRIVTPFAKAWAKEMAHQMEPENYKKDYLGKLIMSVGYPICSFIGKKENVYEF